jgi:hypothetical protein
MLAAMVVLEPHLILLELLSPVLAAVVVLLVVVVELLGQAAQGEAVMGRFTALQTEPLEPQTRVVAVVVDQTVQMETQALAALVLSSSKSPTQLLALFLAQQSQLTTPAGFNVYTVTAATAASVTFNPV